MKPISEGPEYMSTCENCRSRELQSWKISLGSESQNRAAPLDQLGIEGANELVLFWRCMETNWNSKDLVVSPVAFFFGVAEIHGILIMLVVDLVSFLDNLVGVWRCIDLHPDLMTCLEEQPPQL